jgi:hypothetical protein
MAAPGVAGEVVPGGPVLNVTRTAARVRRVTFGPLSVLNVTRVPVRIQRVTFGPLSVLNVTRCISVTIECDVVPKTQRRDLPFPFQLP